MPMTWSARVAQRALLSSRGCRLPGDELGVSMDTTRTYIRRIYEKLHVHTRTDAVVRFLGSSGGASGGQSTGRK